MCICVYPVDVQCADVVRYADVVMLPETAVGQNQQGEQGPVGVVAGNHDGNRPRAAFGGQGCQFGPRRAFAQGGDKNALVGAVTDDEVGDILGFQSQTPQFQGTGAGGRQGASEGVDSAVVHHPPIGGHQGRPPPHGNKLADGFGRGSNRVFVADIKGREELWPDQPKTDVAWNILSWLRTL